MFETVAVVGATGAVGGIIRELLESRKFPHRQLKFLASGRSAGSRLVFAGREYVVEEMTPEAFEGVDLAIGSTPDEVARDFVPWAVARGCTVVDESGFWRMDPKVPLVVPEVNPRGVRSASRNHRQPELLDDANGGGAQAAARRGPRPPRGGQHLSGDQRGRLGRFARVDRQHPGPSRRPADMRRKMFSQAIAFNVIPQIGSPKHQGYTSEEMKMVHETRKIMGDESIQICPTCVRVPVANCHSESILVETERKITVDEARRLFAATPGIIVEDDLAAKHYPTPDSCNGRDEVFIGRIREDLSSPNGLAFWCVSDNVRKGAATNAVQIAELLLAKAGRKPATLSARVGAWAVRPRVRERIGFRSTAAPSLMRTIKLTLAYDGTAYAGWQSQPDRRTLQETLEQRSSRLSAPLRVAASGRTDAGVHALGQVVSFDTESPLSADVLHRALNAELPRDMAVIERR